MTDAAALPRRAISAIPTMPNRASRASVAMECRLAPEGIRQNGDGGYRVALDFHPLDQPDLFLNASAGASFMLVAVELDDDGEPKPPVFIGRPGQNWDEMKPAAQAAMRCRDAAFRRFLARWAGEPIETIEDASDTVCLHCGVNRKRQITPRSQAASLWAELDSTFRYWQLRGDLP